MVSFLQLKPEIKNPGGNLPGYFSHLFGYHCSFCKGQADAKRLFLQPLKAKTTEKSG
jgi:hypothetical protein